MSEPSVVARHVEPVVPGVWRWFVPDDRIGGAESDAFAVADDGGVVLIDPLPIDERSLSSLGEVRAIVLTAANHQRSAWRLRSKYEAPVYAPEGEAGFDQRPDHLYAGGELLPGGLVAFHTPGPTDGACALWRARPVAVVFLGDLVEREPGGAARFPPDGAMAAPYRARLSLRRLLDDLPFAVACFAHGEPIRKDASEQLRTLVHQGFATSDTT